MLRTLHISNFKCFNDQSIGFAPVTVLVGANGAGKSSVVQSLLIARQTLESAAKHEDVLEVELNGAYELQLGNAASIFTNQAQPLIRLTMTDEKQLKTNFEFTFDGHKETHILQATLSTQDKNHVPLAGSFRYLHAERFGPRKSLNMAPSSRIDVGCQGEYVSHAIFLADRSKRTIHNQLILAKQSTQFSHHVESWMQFLFPDLQLSYQTLHDQNLVQTLYSNSILDQLYTSPTNTGFGISYTLPVVVAGLLLSTEDSPTLLVENPEAHLHPLGQSRMGRFLAALSTAGIQVIVETHSEHVVNGMRIFMAGTDQHDDFSIQFFAKSPKGVTVETLKLLQNGELSHWPIGFFDQEQEDLKELLQIKRNRNKIKREENRE
ncbi:DUF3696 domain-containing protein [Tumebacillus flagellatus]|uniref:ATPase AAA-type core domain-containing protein n=1 Tax=Tumebacillus flagellatus TaxID=1157490 RepID=A0A074LV59_9BACL|nr:DUF3696 domain-containing protein [Tumebacillus flagellatus]KEO83858.1 hypothetical protein EL26_08045 [Tumebacillus flagellatus]